MNETQTSTLPFVVKTGKGKSTHSFFFPKEDAMGMKSVNNAGVVATIKPQSELVGTLKTLRKQHTLRMVHAGLQKA